MSEKKSVRIEIPGVTDRKIGRPKSPMPENLPTGKEDGRFLKERDTVQHVLAEDRLRITLSAKEERPLNSVLQGTVHAAEERARLYEEMKSKMTRRKMLKNFFDVFILLMLLTAIVGGYIAWTNHRTKVEAEKTRLNLEAEAERIRLEAERDRVEAEKRERLRQEREDLEKRKRDEREKERLAVEEAQRERRDNAERYQMFKLALKENEFDLFTISVTNDMKTTGGELCFLLPLETTPPPLHWVVYSTNGVVNVYRLDSSGRKEEIDWEMFQKKLMLGKDYIVAKEGKVYFHSNRKKPGVGLLDKSQPGNPAVVFFGKMSDTMKWLQPTYDELTFDIFFTPKGEPKKKIKVENLLFGCSYSLQRVREAVEAEFPFNASGVRSSAGGRRFKRTVKLWNGMTIRKGVDGITYVPATPPPKRPTYYRSSSYSNLSGYHTIYRSRTHSYANGEDAADLWRSLYERAQEEDAQERAFYERQRQSSREAQSRAVSDAERRWSEKIDAILCDGTLSFGIRKAKFN